MFDIHLVEYDQGLLHLEFSIWYIFGKLDCIICLSLKGFSFIANSQKTDMMLDRI